MIGFSHTSPCGFRQRFMFHGKTSRHGANTATMVIFIRCRGHKWSEMISNISGLVSTAMTSELCCRPINNQMPNKIFLESRQFWESTPRRRSHCLTDAELLSISTTLRSHNWQVHIRISESASRIWFLYVARFELAHPSKLRIPTLRILPEGFSQLYFLTSLPF